jgi:hypothetical protein
MLLFRPFGYGGSDVKLCSVFASRGILVHGAVRRREQHEGRIGGLAKRGPSLRIVEGLARCSGLRSSGMKVGAVTQVKFRVLPFRVKP